MGPAGSVGVPRAPTYSTVAVRTDAYRTVTSCGRPFQTVRLIQRRRMALSHGLVRVRSPLLTESRLISFPPGTEMFQFPGFAPNGLCIQPPVTPTGYPVTPGCPIRRSPDQSLFGGSPELIAAFYVLHRLCTPRHSPYTLLSLTTLMKRCDQATPGLTAQSSTRDSLRVRRLAIASEIPDVAAMNLSKTGGAIAACAGARRATLAPQWSRPGSNRQPPRCKRGAHPVELRPRSFD